MVWRIFTIFYIPTTPPRGGPSESCYGKKESVSVLGVLGVDAEDFRAALRDWTVEMALQSHDRSARGFPIGSGRCPHRRGRGREVLGVLGVDEEDFRAALRDWTVEMALQSHDRSARGFPIGSGRCPHRRGRGEESCGTFTNTKKNKSAENAPPPPISSPVL